MADGGASIDRVYIGKREISWPFVLFYIHLNVLGFYGIFVMFTNCSFLTVQFTAALIFLGILGATAGTHRLWAHRTYSANMPLRVFLMLCQTVAGQGTIYSWVQSHRLHHEKFRKEDDPFYSARDFFSAHVRAQVTNYTSEQKDLLKTVQIHDLEEDKVVMFQKKFYWFLYFVLNVLLPVNAPLEYWNDSLAAAIFVTFSLRYLIVLNVCWLINSGHFIWGLDKNFKPSDSNMVFFITKSYWPQYHYLLPNDYKSGEFGNYGQDLITYFIRVFGALNIATNFQTTTSTTIKNGLAIAAKEGLPIVQCIQKQKAEFAASSENRFSNRYKFM